MKKYIRVSVVILLVLLAGCSGVEDVVPTPLTTASTEDPSTPTQSDTTTKTTVPNQETSTSTQRERTTLASTEVPDSDKDGLNNQQERKFGTDPEAADTDGDGLSDDLEINEYDTDPTATDTDGDGLSDWAEIEKHNTDPTAAHSDNDGLDDGSEINQYQSDPTKVDTDSDGLDDGNETDLGTIPTVSDTDEDGLPDGAEVHMSNRFPDASPLKKDIFVEIDYRNRLSQHHIERMVDEFKSAPVSNPDGTTGIQLHVYQDDSIECDEESGVGTDRRIKYGCTFNGEKITTPDNLGYYYIQIVSTVKLAGNARSEPGLATGSIAFVETTTKDHMAGTTMHELGHLLEIHDPGVDSKQRGFTNYPSVMNYLAPSGTLRYAPSDWKDINQSIKYPPGYQAKSDILEQKDKRE